MIKDPQILLKHILESINWIEKDIENLSQDQFLDNIPIQDAVMRRIEIIGEAVRNLSADFKKENPDTPWQDITDMRNKLIHNYFEVDMDLVWETAKRDIPNLKNDIKRIIRTLK